MPNHHLTDPSRSAQPGPAGSPAARAGRATDATLLILIAALLPPKALDVLGPTVEERTVLTPYGEAGPLALRVGPAGAAWVQPYTGLPTRTDARATMYAARQLGVRHIVNWDMAVALNPVIQRGDAAIVVDYISWVTHQPDTFFDRVPLDMDQGVGLVTGSSEPGSAPGGVSSPFCPTLTGCLRQLLLNAPEVVCLATDFLRRETPAEARMFRSFGADVLAYNLAPEVVLAREMGLCYAGLVTVGALSADRPPRVAPAAPDAGDAQANPVATTLHAVANLLPALVAAAGELPACRCGRQ